MRTILLLSATAALAAAQPSQVMPRVLGNITSTNAAFVAVASFAELGPTLVISAFTGNPLAADGLSVIPHLDKTIRNFAGAVGVALPNPTWPNTITPFPMGTFAPNQEGFLLGGGFLVPPKCLGSMNVVSLNETAPSESTLTKISADKGGVLSGGWFYHEGQLLDMDGDGRLDVLAARAIKPIFGDSAGEMVWFQQPSSNPLAPTSVPWAETVLANGSYAPDVFFDHADLNGDGLWEIAYTTYFSGQGLAVLYTDAGNSGPARWTNASGVSRVAVDPSIGTSFGLSIVDLNGDGKVDVLVTNHVDNTSLAGVYAYETPANGNLSDPSQWVRHTLATGFAVVLPLPGQAAPGKAQPFFPCTGSNTTSTSSSSVLRKPWIVVSGDGEYHAYLLVPNNDADPSDWTYTRSLLWNCAGTVGEMAVADVDGDGAAEIFLPCYDTSQLIAFTYQGLC